VKHNYENGVITLSCGTYGNVLRFLIPLIATEAQLTKDWIVVERGVGPHAFGDNIRPHKQCGS
jgi:4-aminobutyrate aminotransferase/(S)-3-amino-2-methylpropionate transaminase